MPLIVPAPSFPDLSRNLHRRPSRKRMGPPKGPITGVTPIFTSVGVALVAYAGLMLLSSVQTFAAPLAAPRGLMQTKRGEVAYTKPPAAAVPAAVPQPLDVKDHLAVGEASWAILRFQDASEVKVRELTQLEIVEPTILRGASLRLFKGEAYYSGLQQSRDTIVTTPHGTVVPRGTELLIRVTERETEVIVFDGE